MGEKNIYMGEKNIYEEEAFSLNQDSIIRPGGLNLTRELIESLELKGSAKILDLGCGTGTTVKLLREEFGLEAYGLDCSEALILRGKMKDPELPLQVGSSQGLPFSDGSIDAILMECSFSTMAEKPKILKEIHRVLSRGGKLGITDVYLRQEPGDLWEKVGQHTGCLVGALTRYKMTDLLNTFGFEVNTWQDKSQLWRAYIGEMLMGSCNLDLLLGAGVNHCQEKDSVLEVIGKTRPGYFLMTATKKGE